MSKGNSRKLKVYYGHHSTYKRYPVIRLGGDYLSIIHPFREGNGRTARILANLMCRKQGYKALKFELINEKLFPFYVDAVQQAAEKEYSKMIEVIETIFPG